MQNACASSATPSFDMLEVVDPSREMPTNFSPELLSAFRKLPEECLPQHPSAGKQNYTIRDSKSRVCEVQLKSRVFFIKKITDGQKLTAGVSPVCAWVGAGS
eukprot:4681221-Alexandrium_andersonii.AAC.1